MGTAAGAIPGESPYNLLCDIEWQDYPLGETRACGGDAVARVDAIQAVEGYRDDLICGEEPEMCVRLRRAVGESFTWKVR